MKFHGFHGNPLCDLRMGCTYKNTHISTTTHPRVQNFITLIPRHTRFNKWLDMQITLYLYS